MMKAGKVALVVFLGLRIATIPCKADDPVQIINTQSIYSVLGSGLTWGQAGAGAVHNQYQFTPLTPDENVCLTVLNNNPTNAHTFQIQVFQVNDPTQSLSAPIIGVNGNSQLQVWTPGAIINTDGKFGSTGNTTPSVAASGSLTFGFRTAAATIVDVHIFSSIAQAGSPDTATLFMSQGVTSGACASNPFTPSATLGATSFTIQALSNVTVTAAAGFVAGPFVNLGQSQHRFIANMGSCNAGLAGDWTLQASFDNSTWFEIGSSVTGAAADRNSQTWVVAEADGAFPFVRFVEFNHTGANCTGVNAWYIGIMNPNPSESAISARYANRGMRSTVTCNSTAATTTLVAAFAQRFVVVYGIQIYAQAGASAQNVTVQDATPATKIVCTIQTTGTSNCPQLSYMPSAYFTGNRGNALQMIQSAAQQVCIGVQFRYEDNPQ